MAAPIFRSSGSVSGIVTGQGRNDLDIGETVTLSDAEVANSGAAYVWVFEDIPIGSSSSLVNPTSATPTFVPDVTGSYRIKVTVNGVDSSVKVIAVPLANSGARIPSFRERTEYDGGGNAKGWHEAMTVALRQLDSVVGGSGYDTVENNGTPVTQRSTINLSTEFTASDVSSKTVLALATAGVGFSKLANLAGLSVLGRSASDSGVMAAITAGTDHHLLRRSGTSLGFGLLVNANVDAAAAIAHTKLADLAAASVLGRSANDSGAMAAITGETEGHVLSVQGDGTIAFSAPSVSLAYSQIENDGTPVTQRSVLNLSTEFTATDDAGNTETDLALTTAGVGFAKLAGLAGLSVLGRAADDSGVMAAITGTDGLPLRVSGTTLGFGTLAAAAFAGTPDNGDVLTITAGVPTWEAPTGGIDGSGAADRLAFWSDADTLTSSAGLTYAANVLTHTASAAGTVVSQLISNTDNTNAGSHARLSIQAGGASGGNAEILLGIAGALEYAIRNENATGDVFRIYRSSLVMFQLSGDTLAFMPGGASTRFVTVENWNAQAGFAGGPQLMGSSLGAGEYLGITGAKDGVAGKGTAIYARDNGASLWRKVFSAVNAAGMPEARISEEGGNVAIGGTGSFGSGEGVVFIADRGAAPSTNPVDGFLLYSESSTGRARTGNGTVRNDLADQLQVADENQSTSDSYRSVVYTSLSEIRTVSLHTPTVKGSKITIKDGSGNAGTGGDYIIIEGNGSDTIDGETTAWINTPYGWMTLEWLDSGAWAIVGGAGDPDPGA